MSNAVKILVAVLIVAILAGGTFTFVKWRDKSPDEQAATPPATIDESPIAGVSDPPPATLQPAFPIVPDPAPVPPRTGRSEY